jgi:hypothetical protein
MSKLIYGDDVRRFWSYVDKGSAGTGCWLWTGCLSSKGRPIFRVKGKNKYAYRWAYEQFVGPIPDGFTIDHVWDAGCRHRHCVNYEAHLEPVAQPVNFERMLRAGQNPHGATHGRAKVTPDVVRELRSRWDTGESQTDLAHEFGITQGTVGKIVRRELWKGVMP